MIATSEVVTRMTQEQNLAKVGEFLGRSDVQQELMKYGVTSEEAAKRLASLSDQEVKQMAEQIDQNMAGGDVIVIGLGTILLIVIILLLIGKL